MKLTPKQAADKVGVSQNLIYLLCREGRLPHYRIGADGRRGRILIDPADLDAFQAACKQDGGPAAAAAPALKHVTPRR